MEQMKMTTYNYPNISVDTVVALRMLIKDFRANPKLLNDSPYDEITKQTLKQLLTGNGDEEDKTENKVSIEDLDYEKETLKLYNDINAIDDMEIDAKERISLIKVKTSILQDLLNMMKESKRIKEINKFEEIVFEILTEEQKDKLLESK